MVTSEVSLQRVAQAIRQRMDGQCDDEEVCGALNYQVQELSIRGDPTEADLPSEPLRCTHRYWHALPKVDGVAQAMKVDPDGLRPALGYLMLVDVGAGENEYSYALYGSRIAAVSGFDMTGKTVWQVATTSVIQIFFVACYEAVRALRRPAYTVHRAPPQITASHWHRLILPLGAGGTVKRFLVCNTPVRRGQLV